MTTTLERPPVTDAPGTFERTTRCGEGAGEHEDDYLFYIDSAIVGRVSADCYVCAWKDGHPRWREAKMAVNYLMDQPSTTGECACASRPRAVKSGYIFYEQDTIVGTLMAYCTRNSWKEGHTIWPLAAMAGHIPMAPADVSLRCRELL